MVCNIFAQIRNRFATDSRKFSPRFAQIRDRFAKVLDTIRADSQQIRESLRRIRDGFAKVPQVTDSRRIRESSPGSRRFATDSRKSSTRFAPIRDTFAADSRIRTHDSHKFARVRERYYTVLRVKCASKDGHVTRIQSVSQYSVTLNAPTAHQ